MMDHGAVVSRIVEEIKNDGSTDFNLDDPFDDPALVTTAFLDILYQDDNGNSALMLAAAENRVLHVKGILTMAINGGKLWKVIDMRNNEGLNSLQMAVRAGSETSAMLITKVAREYAKHKPRPNSLEEGGANEDEITFDMGDKSDENRNGGHPRELMRQSSSLSISSGPARRINREKLANNVLNSAQQGHEYLQMVKRSRSAHSRLVSRRTLSIESGLIEDQDAPTIPLPPQDHGVLSTMGEKIRSIFTRKPPAHSTSLTLAPTTDRLPSASRSMSTDKTASYQDSRKSAEADNNVRLPQQSSDDDDLGGSSMFRNAPWAHSKTSSAAVKSMPPPPNGMVNTPNGVRLPPLSLRRRANSDPKNRDFHSLGDDS